MLLGGLSWSFEGAAALPLARGALAREARSVLSPRMSGILGVSPVEPQLLSASRPAVDLSVQYCWLPGQNI